MSRRREAEWLEVLVLASGAVLVLCFVAISAFAIGSFVLHLLIDQSGCVR